MNETFLSYRRSDSRADAGRLYDRLAEYFGDDLVFMDVDDIEPGENFVRVLESTLDRCAVLLVLIGPRWLTAETASGDARLNDPQDYVRIEIERALARNIRVIPVLVGGATMPAAKDLALTLAPLTQQQAFAIAHEQFHSDVDRLIELVETEAGRRFAPLRWLHRHRLPGAAALLAVLLACVLAWWFAVQQPLQQRRERDIAVAHHLQIAQRQANDGRLALAIDEVEKAVELDPQAIATHRQLAELNAERLQRAAFAGSGPALHIGLSRDYNRQRPVKGEDIDTALAVLYRLFALDPRLENDVDLLLVQAAILKSSGARIKQAISVLQRAHSLAPERADVGAELGLMQSVVGDDAQGLERLRKALIQRPDNARTQFYLARGLDESARCSDADVPVEGALCAEALRGYRVSIELANDDALWSRHIRRAAVYEMRNIFSKIARGAGDILNVELAMDAHERLTSIELLFSHDPRQSIRGWTDDPQYWLARLYEAIGDRQRAKEIISARIAERGSRSAAWQALLERVSAASP